MAQFSSDDVKTALKLSDLAREEFNGLLSMGDNVTVSQIGKVKNFLRDIAGQLETLDQTEEDVAEAMDRSLFQFRNKRKSDERQTGSPLRALHTTTVLS